MKEPVVTREIYWNIDSLSQDIFLVLAFLSLATLVYGVYFQFRRIIKTKKGSLQWLPLKEIPAAFFELISNRKLFRQQKKTGLMHLLFLWGFITLFIGTTLIAIEYDFFQVFLGMEHGFFHGNFFLGFELIMDVMGGLFLLALFYAIFRRKFNPQKQLRNKKHDYIFPIWLIVIMITGYLLEVLRLSATAATLTYNPAWSPIGWIFSEPFKNIDNGLLLNLHFATWWFHAFIVFTWFVSIPFYPKTIHIFTSVANTLLKDSRPNGKMEKIDIEAAFEKDEVVGIMKIEDLLPKQRLDLISCTECGRCEISCPAFNSGKSLSPRDIILDLQHQLKEEEPLFSKPAPEGEFILDKSITRQDIWSCTSCKACVDVCPVYIDPLEKIQSLRKGDVTMNDQYPQDFTSVFSGVEKRGNPWNMPPSSRLDWAQGLEVNIMAEVKAKGEQVEYLYWVGCSAAFDPRNQKIARSLVKIMNAAEVSFAVLGEEENCTGDALRRIGHEYQFSLQAEQNVSTLSSLPFKKIITTCPHCFNSLKNEYPEFGGNYQTVHHTQLIGELLEQAKIKVTDKIDEVITYHDPCYLGRYNGVYDTPRDILKAICKQELVEMKSHRQDSMCCGAGGGMIWMEEEKGKRVNTKRSEEAKQAICGKSIDGNGVVASSCPFCMTMMEDGLGNQEQVHNKDVAELVAEAMQLN